MQHFTAIMVDLAGSKQYSNEKRNQLQLRLVKITQMINRAFAKLLARPIEFSGGDEVQGLFVHAYGAFLCYRLIETFMLPSPVRTGIGTGAWDTRIMELGSTAQDGSAYHTARNAIIHAHKSKMQSVYIDIPDVSKMNGLNLLANAANVFRNELSTSQAKMLGLMEIVYPLNIEQEVDTQYLLSLYEEYAESAAKKIEIAEEIEIVNTIETQPEEIMMPRKMIATLSDYYGSSRQNVSNLIHKGKLLNIRAIDYEIVKELYAMKGVC